MKSNEIVLLLCVNIFCYSETRVDTMYTFNNGVTANITGTIFVTISVLYLYYIYTISILYLTMHSI